VSASEEANAMSRQQMIRGFITKRTRFSLIAAGCNPS
jgi:hypothetical protein